MPLYGLVITTSLLEGLVQLLVERGCHDISIGEGSVDILALSIIEAASEWGSTTSSRPSGSDTGQASLTQTTRGLTGGEEGQGPSQWGSIDKQSPVLEDRLEQ